MDISISGTEFGDDEPLARLVMAARAADVTAVELWYPKNLTALGESESLRQLSRSGLGVACVSTPTELGDPRRVADDVSLLCRAIDLAAELGSPLVNTYFGVPPGRDDERWSTAYAAAVQPCLERAARHGVCIVLENEFDAFGHDRHAADVTRRPHSLEHLLKIVDSPHLKLNFDAANMFCAGESPLDAYHLVRDGVRYVHVKDVTRVTGQLDPRWRRYSDYDRVYETRPMGVGDLPWPDLLSAFAANAQLHKLTLEPHAAAEREDAFVQAAAMYGACSHDRWRGAGRAERWHRQPGHRSSRAGRDTRCKATG